MKQHFYILVFAVAFICRQASAQPTSSEIGQNPIIMENSMENYTVVNKPSLIVVGIECRTSNAPEDAPQDIPRHWRKFYTENIASLIPNKLSDDVIALYCDYEGDYTQPYSFVLGCFVSSSESIPDGLVAKVLPEGPYELHRAIGEHPESVIGTWTSIWQDRDLKRTYTGDYEVYGKKFSGTPQEVEVLIAIEND